MRSAASLASAEDIHTCHARSGIHLARLAVIAHGQAATPLPSGAAAEVARATGAVLAEATAAGRAVAAGAPDDQRAKVTEFLAARLTRLTAAGEDAVTAARDRDAAALRRALRRFDALVAALWAVHRAVALSAAG